ncbi:MAG: hypothetical protein P857_1110 [Candidatus Xenolissoclinum pacificiensis L6]|uniref:Uncharacterized protein n=1 Tax=Candidatus Xenolissoclinum pacificiensis L6 TaxID=1401685 RepID=W2V1D2_9RICK|nr:MAG: hypothetical protein P857_1110 [Candidatus Xenolissoclinum pacificiensis L6]
MYGKFQDNAQIIQSLFDIISKAPNFDNLTFEHKEAYQCFIGYHIRSALSNRG